MMMATKKAAKAPEIAHSYSGYSSYMLQGSQKLPIPTRQTVDVQRSFTVANSGTSVAKLLDRVEALARAESVETSAVKIRGSYRNQLILEVKRPETDRELARRVRDVEHYNAALAAYRADRDALKAWQDESVKEAREKRAKDEKAREARAERLLIEQTKDRLRSDAKFMGTLLDDTLSDEKFVKLLRAAFKAGQAETS